MKLLCDSQYSLRVMGRAIASERKKAVQLELHIVIKAQAAFHRWDLSLHLYGSFANESSLLQTAGLGDLLLLLHFWVISEKRQARCCCTCAGLRALAGKLPSLL